MQIKTIYEQLQDYETFDRDVNAALAEGWRLMKREHIPGYTAGNRYAGPILYAELVKLDEVEPTDPHPMDPVMALHALQEFCDSRPCDETCPLQDFCGRHLPNNEGPADWDLSNMKE